MELLEGMLQKDKDEFRRISNRLLSTCFLCKGNQATRSEYYFVLKYREKFRDFLDVLGYRLEINEEYGVIQLTNPQNYNHLNLKLYESIILLIGFFNRSDRFDIDAMSFDHLVLSLFIVSVSFY